MGMYIPEYFKNTFAEVEQTVKNIKKGKVSIGCKTPGGKNVYVVQYGEENKYERKANYSSAIGGLDYSCYADKKKPCVFLIGGVHGGEFEGIAAILNLISLLETGRDLKGRKNEKLLSLAENTHLILIPCVNVDGRERVPFESFAGETLETLRYYDQGTWKDGSLCGWPDCKKEHPIKNVEHLGGYFNDDGINLMHDNFFNPMAKETKLMLSLAEKYAPDVIANLHGAAEKGHEVLSCKCLHKELAERAIKFDNRMYNVFKEKGLPFAKNGCENNFAEFNLTAAFYMCCGAYSVTWESYQGVKKYDEEVIPDTILDEILDAHLIFFEEFLEFAKENYQI